MPEWNQDTESFNALVESAALDIHAYIIQCNDRQYGDSRVRAPYKESWKRDLVRIKEGKMTILSSVKLTYLHYVSFSQIVDSRMAHSNLCPMAL